MGFEDESFDFFFDKAGVPDVVVQDDFFGEPYGLKGREEFIVEKGGYSSAGRVGDGDAVEQTFCPAGGGEDTVDAATNMGVEFLQVIAGDPGGLDEAVEFEHQFVFRA